MCIVYISANVHSIQVFSNKYYKIYQPISIHGLIFLYASYWYWTILAIVGAKSVFPVWLLEGQIERKCQNRISKGNSELTGAQWVPSRAVLAYVCPKRPNMGQIGPRDIGADLDFGADLALSILQCIIITITLLPPALSPYSRIRNPIAKELFFAQ